MNTLQIFIVAELVWLFFKGVLLFPLWLFIALVGTMIILEQGGKAVAKRINKKLLAEYTKLNKVHEQ